MSFSGGTRVCARSGKRISCVRACIVCVFLACRAHRRPLRNTFPPCRQRRRGRPHQPRPTTQQRRARLCSRCGEGTARSRRRRHAVGAAARQQRQSHHQQHCCHCCCQCCCCLTRRRREGCWLATGGTRYARWPKPRAPPSNGPRPCFGKRRF